MWHREDQDGNLVKDEDNLIKEKDVLNKDTIDQPFVDQLCKVLESKLRTPPKPEEETKAGLYKRLARFAGCSNSIGHPNFDELPPWSDEDLVQVWEDVSEYFPSYKNVAASFRERYKSPVKTTVLMDKLDLDKGLCDDLCTLAGVDKSQRKVEETDSLHKELVTEILNGDLPKGLEITISEKYLEVNGVPTKISGKKIEYLFLGLTEFLGKKAAIKKTASLIRKKLKKLY